MRYIGKLSDEEKITLEEGYRNHKKLHFRNRCKSLLMSSDGYTVPEIARFFKVRTRTIYEWYNRWEKMGLVGLMILPGRGGSAPLDNCTPKDITMIKEAISEHPQNLRNVCKDISKKLGFEISEQMLRRFIKKNSIIHGNV
jgi:transposase